MNVYAAEIMRLEAMAVEERFRPGRVAKRRRCSMRQLQRITRAALRKTPREWFWEIKARETVRLKMQGLSNKEIVVKLHFSSAAQLCHLVKRVFGKPLRQVVLDALSSLPMHGAAAPI